MFFYGEFCNYKSFFLFFNVAVLTYQTYLFTELHSTQFCYLSFLHSYNATCFTIFPCVSLGTYAHIAVLLVMCRTLAIVLTRPADAWRLKGTENDLLKQGIVKRKKWISNSMTFPKIYQETILYDMYLTC